MKIYERVKILFLEARRQESEYGSPIHIETESGRYVISEKDEYLMDLHY